MKEEFVLSQLNYLESLHDSEITSLYIENNKLILVIDDVCPPTLEMSAYQANNGVTRKLKAVYHFPFELDRWTSWVTIIYYKSIFSLNKVTDMTLADFVTFYKNKSKSKKGFRIEILHQFFDEKWCEINGIVHDSSGCIADISIRFYCSKIEYFWEEVKR